MKTKRLSFAVLAAAMSLAAPALAAPAAEEQEPGVESEAPAEEAPAEEAPPPGDAAAATPAPPPAITPGADAVFGTAGQITISSDLQLSAMRFSFEGSPGQETHIQLRPALDFFPVTNLSLGGQVIIGYRSLEDSTAGIDNSTTELGLLARAGYNFTISPTVSIWPRVSLGYLHVADTPYTGSPEITTKTVPLQVDVPVVFHPAQHFFIGGGPVVTSILYSQRDDTFGAPATQSSGIGLQSTLGGYFQGF
jgi:hypothetical protein